MEAGDEGVDGAGEGEEGGEDVGYAGVGAPTEGGGGGVRGWMGGWVDGTYELKTTRPLPLTSTTTYRSSIII